MVSNELERILMEAVMVYFKELSRLLPGGANENNEKPQDSRYRRRDLNP
jgi:hypothetical protein